MITFWSDWPWIYIKLYILHTNLSGILKTEYVGDLLIYINISCICELSKSFKIPSASLVYKIKPWSWKYLCYELFFFTPTWTNDSIVLYVINSWVPDPAESPSTEDMARALSDASVFVVFMSGNYAKDEECKSLFKYAVLTLRKHMVVVAVGENFDWKSSKLGIHLSDTVSRVFELKGVFFRNIDFWLLSWLYLNGWTFVTLFNSTEKSFNPRYSLKAICS